MQSAPICNTVAYYILEMCWGEVFLKNLTNFRMHLAWQKNLIIHKLINAHIAFGETQHFHLRTTFFKFFFFKQLTSTFSLSLLKLCPSSPMSVVGCGKRCVLLHFNSRPTQMSWNTVQPCTCTSLQQRETLNHWKKNSAVFSHFQLLLHCSLKVQRFGLRGI